MAAFQANIDFFYATPKQYLWCWKQATLHNFSSCNACPSAYSKKYLLGTQKHYVISLTVLLLYYFAFQFEELQGVHV